jgi:glucokinase
MILAGDIGGTKTNLACFQADGERLTPVSERTVKSADYPGLEAVVESFLRETGLVPTSACFGVAGPVIDGQCKATNLPWVVDLRALQRAVGAASVSLINDLEATAYGIRTLPEGAFAVLQPGRPQPQGNIVVIAAGTGLGEAALLWDNGRYHAMASEGGHADFAPRNPLELELCRFLLKAFGHASYERVLSGPGKLNIYRFLKETGRWEEPAWLAEELDHGDPSAKVSEFGLSGRSELCVQALDLFVSIYGAEAGNLALKFLARGGVYVGGGIAPKIIQKLTDGTFIKAFTDKGRLEPFLSTIPVRVVLEQKAALYGAAHYGWSQVAPRAEEISPGHGGGGAVPSSGAAARGR